MAIKSASLPSTALPTQNWEPSAPPPPKIKTFNDVRDHYAQLTTKDEISKEMALLDEQVNSGEINENLYITFANMLKDQFEHLPSAPPLADMAQAPIDAPPRPGPSLGQVAEQRSQALRTERPVTRQVLNVLDFFSGRR
ncbi:hypothetical protein [Pseudomonas sp. MWU15-20650]|uniref:hypothetical protein n=1 Tax=Pseudomonas sp. MWU15-20650 TaxID=2933107 RepID=UPI00200D73F4|nr:hypothetical protein [Pseudomonas sp. MWU15-20650]